MKQDSKDEGHGNTEPELVPKSPLLATLPRPKHENLTQQELSSKTENFNVSVDSREVSRIDSTALGANSIKISSEPTQPAPPNNRTKMGLPMPFVGSNKSGQSSERIADSIDPDSGDQFVFSGKNRMPKFFSSARFFGKNRSMRSTKAATMRFGKEGLEGLPVQESKQKGAQNLVFNDLRVVENKSKPSLCVASIAFLVVFLAVVSPLVYFVTNSSENSEEDFSSCGSTERNDELRNLVTTNAVISDSALSFGSLVIDCLPPRAFSNIEGIEEVERIDLSRKGLTKVCSNAFSGTNLGKVTEFQMGQNGLQELPDSVFAGMSDVVEIDLSANAFQTLNNPVFEGLQSIERIILNDNSGLVSFPAAITSATSITNLQLVDSTSISYATENLFSDFTSLTIVISPETAILPDSTRKSLDDLGQRLGGVTISFPL